MLSVVAPVGSSVRYDDQRSPLIPCLLHLLDTHIDRVQQGSTSFRRDEQQPGLYLLRILRKVVNQRGTFANVIKKNSSWGLEDLSNSVTASRARSSFLSMLPLTLRSMPVDTGASSLPKCLISCCCLPS